MKSLFHSIRAGLITREACQAQLARYQGERTSLIRLLAEQRLGIDLYKKRMSDLKFSMDLLQIIIVEYDKLKKPLKVPIKDKANY